MVTIHVTLSLHVIKRRKFIQRQRVALQRIDELPSIACGRFFAHAQGRARLVHQPAILFFIRAALAAKSLEKRKERAMMPIEEMMFDAPASIKAEQAHAPWLTKALDKRLLAGKPGIENHRIAQQQLVMAVIAQQQQIFSLITTSPRSLRHSHKTQYTGRGKPWR